AARGGRALLLAGSVGTGAAGLDGVFCEWRARLPLGTGVAVEFAGPVAVAALGSRRLRDVGALGLVAVGVVLIADVQLRGSPLGVVFALAAAAAWAAYIVLGKRVALAPQGVSGQDSLAVGLT